MKTVLRSLAMALAISVVSVISVTRVAAEDLLSAPSAGDALMSPATIGAGGGGTCCCGQTSCGSGCCESGEFCNPLRPGFCCDQGYIGCASGGCCPSGTHCTADGGCAASCPASAPVQCGNGCCESDQTCNPLRPGFCCDPGYFGCATGSCCPNGTHCTPDGSCEGTCEVDCGNGLCCPSGTACNTLDPFNTRCCDSAHTVFCEDGPGCCATGNSCNTVNPNLCCLPGYPVQCSNTCCAAGYQCSGDGNSCVTFNPCTDPEYPTDCGNDFCCPSGDRCDSVLVGDVIHNYCCYELPKPEDDCCSGKGAPPLAQSLGGTAISSSTRGGSGSQCRKSTKVRPFEVLQVAAATTGAPASFDLDNHQYSLAFVTGKKGTSDQVVLKVPLIPEDSTSSSLSVMIPPFLLNKKSNGKADVFLITDGVTSDTCLSRVRIAKLPKSASKKTGLVTLSWLRANHMVYTTAKPTLSTAAAAPFVDPEVLADVDKTIASVESVMPSFEASVGKKGELTQTAKHADSLVTGMLAAGGKVADGGFAAASQGWVAALAAAKDANDPALKAAEATYATTVLGAGGPSAQSVAKFTVACGAVTTAGVNASATKFAGGASASSGIDAQAASTSICGSTVTATGVVCGVTALAGGAGAAGSGRSAYGKTLLKGSVHTAQAMQKNYGKIQLAGAKLCGCRHQPVVKRIIDTCITIIDTCDHIRRVAPRLCLADGEAKLSPSASLGECDETQVSGGAAYDTRVIDLGRTSGTFRFDYRTYTNKDRMVISYQGATLFDTGCVSTPDEPGNSSPPLTQFVSYSGRSRQISIDVIPNCEGVSSSNEWDYFVGCP